MTDRPPSFHARGLGRLPSVIVALLSGMLLPGIAQSGLPQYAFSIPSGGSASDGVKAAQQCGLMDKVVVMPALNLRLAGGDGADNSFDQQAQSVSALGADAEVFLRVTVGAGAVTGADAERQITDRVGAFLKRMPLSAGPVRGLIVDVAEPVTNLDLVTFAVIDLAVQAKAAKPDLRLVFAFPPGFIDQHGDTAKRIATYFDLLGIVYAAGWETQAKWVAEQALNKPLLLKLSPPDAATYLAATLETSETLQIIWSDSPDEKSLASSCAVNTLVSRFVTKDMNAVPASGVAFSITADGSAPMQSKWFISGPTADLVFLGRVNRAAGRRATLKLHGATGTIETQWYDVLSGAQLTTGPIIKTPSSLDQTASCECQYVLAFIHNTGDADARLSEALEVHAHADLTLEEIIARWQQYRESQRQKLDNYMADCALAWHFEGTNIGSGFDIMFRYKEFASRDNPTEWEQLESYVNGVKFGHNQEFPLPQLEPEKVLTQPLELTLNAKYEYKLLGTEEINGVLCYVISVEPNVQGEVLFSGKIWIDGITFRQVKQYLTQRGDKSNVISNVETQVFELIPDDKGNKFNLITSITAQQLVNAAGRDFVLQKTYQFSGFAINSMEFAGALKAAYDSSDPMYRDTDTGLRRLKKEGDQRVLDTNTEKQVKALVGGAFYEGTFNFPIPIAGYSFADFNYKNTGAQLSLFFAGPVLVANASKEYGRHFRLGVDLALSALPGNNRIYSGNTELTGEEIYTWEQTIGFRATWQATTGLSITGSYYLAYDYFHSTSDTSPLYTLPRDGYTLMPSAEIKYAHRGYIFTAQGTYGQRLGWRRFGYTAQPDPFHNNFNVYSADLNKTYYLPKFMRFGWDFAYYGGDDLDRISRYWPSFFSVPRLHGIPGGTDSFDAIAMGNVSYGFNVLDLIKIEGLYSYARARDLEESAQFKEFDGVELNFGTAGPWATYLQGTVSYALDGNIERYNSRWGVLFMIFKPLK